MAITVNKTNGLPHATIRDGSANTSGALTLLGKNYSGFSSIIAANFLHLLENSASANPPGESGGAQGAPITGQLWYNSSTLALSVYDGANWQQLANLTVNPTVTAPTTPATGDLWWDTTVGQLKGYTGSSWSVIGPPASSGFSQSGQTVISVTDSDSNPHSVTKEYLDGTLIAIYSKDPTFTTSPSTANLTNAEVIAFPTINPGINLSASISNIQLSGKASNANLLDALDSTAFLKANGSIAATGAIRINTDSGLTLGDGQDLQLIVTGGKDITFTNQTAAGTIQFATTGNANISLLAGTGQLLTSSSYTPSSNYSITTKSYVDAAVAGAAASLDSSTILLSNGSHTITGNLIPATTNTVTLGNSSVKFSNVYSTAFTGNLTGNVSGSSVTASGAVTSASAAISGNVTVGNIAVSGTMTINGQSNVASIIPQITNTYTLGSTSSKFATVYATTVSTTTVTASDARVTGLYTDNLYYANGTAYSFNLTAATTADNLWVSGAYRAASTSSTADTVVARDGSADIYANVFRGMSAQSRYADLAEKYDTDQEYQVGTVIMVGGEREVTAAQAGCRAIGVISENPAYLMNSFSPAGQAIALKGMVPVKVIGIVSKGDRLIASDNGTAVAVSQGHVDTFAIALETSENADIKLINATIL